MISVLMATYNGAATLPRVLDGYALVEVPKGGYELIVVDNASSDATPDVVRSYADRLPLKYLRTERRGKNVALNIGIPHCSGDAVVLTDDDAVPAPYLLRAYRSALDDQPDYDLFGGHIRPLWPQDCPEWILRLVNLGAAYGVTPSELRSGPTQAERLWGANMAVRRKLFDDGHRFNEGVGPAAGQYMMGSETEFTHRLEAQGYASWFVEDGVVGHIIRPEQLREEWLIQRSFRLGRGLYRHERRQFTERTPMIRGIPRWKYREFLEEAWRAVSSRVAGNFERRFQARWNLSMLQGYFFEAAQQQRIAQR